VTAVLVGSLTAGELNPPTLTATASVEAQLSANLTAALALQAQASLGAPPLTVQLAAVVEAEAALNLGISLGLPGVTFSISAAAALVAAAQLALGNLTVLVNLLAGPSGGMFVYSYAGGTLSSLGSDLTSALSSTPPPGLPGSTPVAGILVGASASSWATVSPYFGGL
jgi:hypothetical protein